MASTVYSASVIPIAEDEALAGGSANISAVSWAAIIAGGFASLATTLILLVLGAGIGLSMISPWYGAAASAGTVGVTAVIWLIIVQWLSSGVGGFLAGRLRTRWRGLHTHEVFFRDTAHGFLVWSLAGVAGAAMFASIASSGVGAVTQSNRANTATRTQDTVSYYSDSLFRSGNPASDRADPAVETGRIFANSMQDSQIVLSAPDRAYIAQMIAGRTGVSQGEAEQRVDNVVAQLNDDAARLRAAAEKARRRAAQLSIVGALSMLIGAFIASAAAAVGGSIRDEY